MLNRKALELTRDRTHPTSLVFSLGRGGLVAEFTHHPSTVDARALLSSHLPSRSAGHIVRHHAVELIAEAHPSDGRPLPQLTGIGVSLDGGHAARLNRVLLIGDDHDLVTPIWLIAGLVLGDGYPRDEMQLISAGLTLRSLRLMLDTSVITPSEDPDDAALSIWFSFDEAPPVRYAG
ncbi:MAG: hypothetical protein AAGI30_14225 [Planctomycetota bacterium]